MSQCLGVKIIKSGLCKRVKVSYNLEIEFLDTAFPGFVEGCLLF